MYLRLCCQLNSFSLLRKNCEYIKVVATLLDKIHFIRLSHLCNVISLCSSILISVIYYIASDFLGVGNKQDSLIEIFVKFILYYVSSTFIFFIDRRCFSAFNLY